MFAAVLGFKLRIFRRVDPTRTLLSLHASVNMKDLSQQNTPLHLACIAQNTNVIMLLVQAGADLDAKNSKVGVGVCSKLCICCSAHFQSEVFRS